MKIKRKHLNRLIENYLILEESNKATHVGKGKYHYQYDDDGESIIILNKGAREDKSKNIVVKTDSKYYNNIKKELDAAGFNPPTGADSSDSGQKVKDIPEKEKMSRGKYNENLRYICQNYFSILQEFHNALTLGGDFDGADNQKTAKELSDMAKSIIKDPNITSNVGNQIVLKYVNLHLERYSYLAGGHGSSYLDNFDAIWDEKLTKGDTSLSYDVQAIPWKGFKKIKAGNKSALLGTRNKALESANLYLQKMLEDNSGLESLSFTVKKIHDANINVNKAQLAKIEKVKKGLFNKKKLEDLKTKYAQFISALEEESASSVSKVETLANVMIQRINDLKNKGTESQVANAKIFLKRHNFIGRS